MPADAVQTSNTFNVYTKLGVVVVVVVKFKMKGWLGKDGNGTDVLLLGFLHKIEEV